MCCCHLSYVRKKRPASFEGESSAKIVIFPQSHTTKEWKKQSSLAYLRNVFFTLVKILFHALPDTITVSKPTVVHLFYFRCKKRSCCQACTGNFLAPAIRSESSKNAAVKDPPPDWPRPSTRSSKTPHPMREEVKNAFSSYFLANSDTRNRYSVTPSAIPS